MTASLSISWMATHWHGLQWNKNITSDTRYARFPLQRIGQSKHAYDFPMFGRSTASYLSREHACDSMVRWVNASFPFPCILVVANFGLHTKLASLETTPVLRIGISIERKRIRHEMNTKSRQYGADWERYVGNSRILWYGSASCHSEWEYPQVVEPWNSQMMTLTFLFLSKRLRICTVVSERKNQASDRSDYKVSTTEGWSDKWVGSLFVLCWQLNFIPR